MVVRVRCVGYAVDARGVPPPVPPRNRVTRGNDREMNVAQSPAGLFAGPRFEFLLRFERRLG